MITRFDKKSVLGIYSLPLFHATNGVVVEGALVEIVVVSVDVGPSVSGVVAGEVGAGVLVDVVAAGVGAGVPVDVVVTGVGAGVPVDVVAGVCAANAF